MSHKHSYPTRFDRDMINRAVTYRFVATLLCVAAAATAAVSPLPLVFEKNQGQTDDRVDFLSRGSGYTLFLSRGDAVIRMKSAAVRMRLLGAVPEPEVEGLEPLPGRSNYLFGGGDRSKWKTDIGHYGRVRYSDVYPGVDLVYYGKEKQLEYDFVVSPGADPAAIKLQFEGAKRVRVDRAGDLVVTADGGDLRFHRPVIYQDIDGQRVDVPGRFRTTGSRVAFSVGKYRRDLPLVIDPVLSYSTYLGGSGDDQTIAMGIDAAGNAYIGGVTGSSDFPATTGAIDTQLAGSSDIFVAKLNSNGTALLYATFLGSPSNEQLFDLAVDAAGNVYLLGYGEMTSTPGAYQPCSFGCRFLAKLTTVGNQLTYLTALDGGCCSVSRVVVGQDGTAYVAASVPYLATTTVGAYQPEPAGGSDVYIVRLNATGTGAVYATYVGGNSEDGVADIAVDETGNGYIIGSTASANFPTTSGVVHPTSTSNASGFALKLNPGGTALIYSTKLRGVTPTSLAVRAGEAVILGTRDQAFETTLGSYLAAPHSAGSSWGALLRLNTAATSYIYATALEPHFGYVNQPIGALAVDAAGNAYVAATQCSFFPCGFPPTADAFQPNHGGSSDVSIAKFNPTGSVLLYSTFLGGSSVESVAGIALDSAANLYVAGTTSSLNLPTTPGAYSSTLNGTNDAFIARIDNQSIACSFTLATSTAALSPTAGSGTVGITANTGCVWVATVGADSSWIQVTSGGSGIGSGVVSYTFAANPSVQPRQGVITIGGQTYTITQAGAPCTYSIAPQSLAFDAQGGISNVSVITPQGCNWNALSNATWITISTTPGGNGPAALRYTVAANPGQPRSGTMTIAGQTFTVSQSAAGCSYALSSTSQTAPQSGGSFSTTVTAPGGCSWTASTSAQWITIATPSGAGTSAVNYTVAPNSGAARSGVIIIGGVPLSVTQCGTNGGVLTDNTLFVRQLYLDILGREPDNTGLTGWVAMLANGSQTRASVATALFSSPEFSLNGMYIFKLYRAVLQRDPDFAGFTGWLDLNVKGLSQEAILNAFLGSQEFSLTYGNLTNEQFVTLVYQNVLGRAPDSAGFLLWTGELAAGRLTRAQVMDSFVRSAEFDMGIRNRGYAYMLYVAFLRRSGASAEVEFYADRLTNGQSTLPQLVGNFIDSPEYKLRFQ